MYKLLHVKAISIDTRRSILFMFHHPYTHKIYKDYNAIKNLLMPFLKKYLRDDKNLIELKKSVYLKVKKSSIWH